MPSGCNWQTRAHSSATKQANWFLLKWTYAEKEKKSLCCLDVLELKENSRALTQSEGVYLRTYLCAATIVGLFVCTPRVLSASVLYWRRESVQPSGSFRVTEDKCSIEKNLLWVIQQLFCLSVEEYIDNVGIVMKCPRLEVSPVAKTVELNLDCAHRRLDFPLKLQAQGQRRQGCNGEMVQNRLKASQTARICTNLLG